MNLSRSITGALALAASLLATVPATAEMTLEPGTSVTFHHHDLLGSPVMVSDHKGRVLWYENTRPYGESMGKVSSSGLGHLDNTIGEATSQLGYTGHTVDSTSGLVYMQARYYDPVIGRFYSNDPVGFTASNPMMFNRYAYANNNPYTFVDPDGREVVLSEEVQKNETGASYEELKSDPVTGPMIETLENSEETYNIVTYEEIVTGGWFQNLLNTLFGVDPKTELGASYLDNQRTIAITPGVQAEVYDFLKKEKVVISHSGVLAHEIGHAFVHYTLGIGRGRGGQTEGKIHRLVDNPRLGIQRSTTGTFVPGSLSR